MNLSDIFVIIKRTKSVKYTADERLEIAYYDNELAADTHAELANREIIRIREYAIDRPKETILSNPYDPDYIHSTGYLDNVDIVYYVEARQVKHDGPVPAPASDWIVQEIEMVEEL